MLCLLATILCATGVAPDPGVVYSGQARQLDVAPPRLLQSITVDGVLDEPAWHEAARLTGFSQYSPIDNVPAGDSTEVLVWYSATAIHFGIIAHEAHGAPRATLADRDKIFSDDHVQLLIGTFDDGQQATYLAVNPYGVQGDGTLNETGQRISGMTGAGFATRDTPDLSQDFVYQSKGRVTEDGYVVEVRVPFKSLRFQAAREQRWALQIVRRVQHAGADETWAPARRDAASFLAQSGHLAGLHDLHRGLVLDAIPELTARSDGAPGAAGWNYGSVAGRAGGTVRWGVTNNLGMSGTANPDFSQVEADAGQVAFDPRQALFFAERRPFFLDGLEQFETPNQLVYTRRIVRPVAAVKLAGTAFGTRIGLLSAVDETSASTTGDHPFANALRLQKDLGGQSRVGVLYTDRVDGRAWNRVGGVDARLLFGGIWAATLQLAASRTRTSGDLSSPVRTYPLWVAEVAAEGRRFGLRAGFNGIHQDFATQLGFIERPGIINGFLNPRVRFDFGTERALQALNVDVVGDGRWQYRTVTAGESLQELKGHLNLSALFRGGWNAGASVFVERFGYDSLLYASYRLGTPHQDGSVTFQPFTGTRTLPNLDLVVQAATPELRRVSASVFIGAGRDENFFEWSSARLDFGNVTVSLRPSDQLRLAATYDWQNIRRNSDRTTVQYVRIPRLKLEYQVSRAFSVRAIGNYVLTVRDSLRDDSRTNLPLYVETSPGAFERLGAERRGNFRWDVLLQFLPVPGTVLYAGYGATRLEGAALDPSRPLARALQRTADAFFLKASYLFRL